MPKRTKSSIHRKALQLTLAPATTRRLYSCAVGGCSGIFKNSTDLSRHKWVHLPAHLYPTCPFVGCQVKYVGRASQIKIHWENCHQEAGPYPSNAKFPTLASILARNYITLEGNSPPILTAHTAHTAPPASSSDQVARLQRAQQADSLGRMQPNMQLSPDQCQFVAAQEYPVVRQEYVQQSFNNDYPQYETTPICSPLDNGVQMAMWGYPSFINADSPAIPQYPLTPNYSAPDYGGHHEVYHGYPILGQDQHVPPFNLQVENQGWDFPLSGQPPACASTIDPEWNPFEIYPDF